MSKAFRVDDFAGNKPLIVRDELQRGDIVVVLEDGYGYLSSDESGRYFTYEVDRVGTMGGYEIVTMTSGVEIYGMYVYRLVED